METKKIGKKKKKKLGGITRVDWAAPPIAIFSEDILLYTSANLETLPSLPINQLIM